MKNKFQDFINEGLRINPEFLNKNLYDNKKIYTIGNILFDMKDLYEYMDTYLNEEYIIDIKNEILHIIKELEIWKEDGWKNIKFDKGEWYPLK